MRAQIIKTVYIEVARRLNAQTDGPECYTGNSYRIDLIAEGPISEAVGWVVDYADLKSLFEPVYSMLDHHCLSDLPGLECDSSPEALEVWINRQLFPRPSWFSGVRVYPVEPGGFHLQRLEAEMSRTHSDDLLETYGRLQHEFDILPLHRFIRILPDTAPFEYGAQNFVHSIRLPCVS